jgi:hypothetical protein
VTKETGRVAVHDMNCGALPCRPVAVSLTSCRVAAGYSTRGNAGWPLSNTTLEFTCHIVRPLTPTMSGMMLNQKRPSRRVMLHQQSLILADPPSLSHLSQTTLALSLDAEPRRSQPRLVV